MRKFLYLAVWLGCTATVTPPIAAQIRKPNVIVLLADDLGYGELGAQGNKEIPTPHTDSIAKNGVRFTDGYVAATYCSPSRAGLLTGRYPTRFGHEFNDMATESENPVSKFGLPLTETTMADRLKALGYATGMVGKWHLGYRPDNRPTKRGFTEFYGTLANTPYFHPRLFVDSRLSDDVREVKDSDFYTTDAYADRAVDFIERNKTKPFFLYLPFNAQHGPLQASPKYLDRVPKPITNDRRRIYAAMLIALDDAIGRVLAKVREIGQEENTLVWYLSDNGSPSPDRASQIPSSNNPLRGYKATTLEGGMRIPFMVQWKGKIKAGQTFTNPIINLDILPTTLVAMGGKVDPAWKLDGVDLLPYLTGGKSDRPHDTLYWRFGDQWAIRQGDWKLVVSRIDGPTPKLFNLAGDIGEANDLAAQNPDKIKQMTKVWQAWNAEQKPPLWRGSP
jgi:arylsulfatase A-like enzyme